MLLARSVPLPPLPPSASRSRSLLLATRYPHAAAAPTKRPASTASRPAHAAAAAAAQVLRLERRPRYSLSTIARARTMTSSSAPAAPPSTKDIALRRASGFRYWLDVQTRWSDQDQYAHINNAVYYHAADAAINAYLISTCGLEPVPKSPAAASTTGTTATTAPTSRDVLGLMISTSATYFAPASFPNILRVGMRVIKLGSSSALFELGIFEVPLPPAGQVAAAAGEPLAQDALAVAVTRATHVYVDRVNRRPVKPIPKGIQDGLAKLVVEEFAVGGGGDGGSSRSSGKL